MPPASDAVRLPIRNSVDAAAGLRLRRIVRAGDYDIVHFHTARAHALAPYLSAWRVTMRRGPGRASSSLAGWITCPIVGSLHGSLIALLMASQRSRPRWRTRWQRLELIRDRIALIPSGIDCDRFQAGQHKLARLEARARHLRLTVDQFVIGTVGMLEPRKGHRFLIEALARIERANGNRTMSARCIIAGGGSLLGRIKRIR